VSDIDSALVDSLKVLDPEWPIREADISWLLLNKLVGDGKYARRCNATAATRAAIRAKR
jgi:hypothetical protein